MNTQKILNEAKANLEASKERIDKFLTNVNKVGKDKRTEILLRNRVQLLDSYWQSFIKTNDALYRLVADDDQKREAYFTDDVFSTVETAYMDALGWLKEQLAEFEENPRDASLLNSSAHNSTTHTYQPIKLPRVNLPTFSGSYYDWPSFRDTYISLIHQNHNLTNIEKMHYLKAAVTGEAAKLLKHFVTTSANYSAAWDTLSTRFENKRVLVNSNLNALVNIPAMAGETAAELRRLVDGFNLAVRTLNNLARPTEHWDDWFVFLLSNKLDNCTRKDWETSLSSSTDVPSFKSLQTFLESRLQALSAIKDSVKILPRPVLRQQSSNLKFTTRSHHTTKTKSNECGCCGRGHFIMFCPQFRSKTIEERIDLLRKRSICTNCLKSSHVIATCTSDKTCQRCNQKHHTMIHQGPVPDTEGRQWHKSEQSTSMTINPMRADTSKSSSTLVHVASSHVNEPRQATSLLATAMVLIRAADGGTIRARALVDPGSEPCLITASLANALRLVKRSADVSIFGIRDIKVGKANTVVLHEVISIIDPSKIYTVQSLVLPSLTRLIPAKRITNPNWPHIAGLQLADPSFDKPSGIDLIIGVDLHARIILGDIREGPVGTPLAQATTLGWILSGPTALEAQQDSLTTSFHVTTTTSNLDTLLRKFWEIEEPPQQHLLDPKDVECEMIFQKTHYRDENGRFVVRLPIRNTDLQLGDSREAALTALIRMERRFNRDPPLLKAYSDFMEEYLSLNHMELVQDERETQGPVYYLPHHAVLKPTSSTTKLRVVFNASQQTHTGVSLNDLLHIGPKLQNDVFIVLARWRFFPYVFTGDLEKMFRQILINPADTDLQRILWRPSPSQPVSCYRLRTVTYGTAAAPYLACKVLKQLADDHHVAHPEGAKIIHENTYVDDVLFGSYEKATAIRVRDELKTIFKYGGFNLRKWMSNTPELLADIPEADKTTGINDKLITDSQIKTLGLGWNPQLDAFRYYITLPSATSSSKRSILSDISKIYDPLGWLSPVTITSKILLQKLWTAKIGWDDQVPDDLNSSWLDYKSELKHINDLNIKRWLGTGKSLSNAELHGFCDASQAAYGAAVYLRIVQDPNKSHVTLIAAKTRVSPLRTVSLPRLELCGAALLAELISYIQHNLNLEAIPSHAWSDSTVVLAWLREHPSKWKVFIANRVALIHEKVPQTLWHHVPTAQNPADCITRGIPAAKLKGYKLWWSGPDWLAKSPVNWPKMTNISITSEVYEAIRPNHSTSTFVAHSVDDSRTFLLQRYSDLSRLLRTTAYCLRFFYNSKTPAKLRHTGYLSLAELDLALEHWIKVEQREAYPSELNCLASGASVPTTTKLKALNPIIDFKNILRVGGRLKNALLSEDETHPIILPADSYLTKLLIANAHSKTLHGGTQATLQQLRQRYWIPNGRRKVRQFIHRCVICCRARAKTPTPLMGDLPPDRVRPAKPFLHSGVDYAGPFIIKPTRGRGRTRLKCYVAVFVCFCTRAVHLELVTDLTTEAFIAAFRRFISRRGRCAKLYSDNGKNFVGADRQLSKYLYQLTHSKDLPQLTLKEGTEWHFIPPASPHFGGLWEAGVKSFKHHLKRVVGSQVLTLEEMFTLLAQIESCLNSRPLNAITDDPMDLNALTPGHFLVGESLLAVPTPTTLGMPLNRLDRWQLVQQAYESLWARWYKEYLCHLQSRYRWQHKTKPITVNDLVVIKEDKLPPQHWRLGRVTELHPGAEEQVRVVTLRHKDGYCKRPVTKLCILPIDF